MAIVPMPDGPRVNPTVPDAKPISILEPRESKITAQSIANAQSSSNGLLKAARESYERMSDARATEAYNNVRIAVNDLLMGENGALQKKGTEVTNSKKPFVQDYYEQIEKIFEQETKGLDTYQRQLLEGRKQKYLANRRSELTQHLIQQADAVQTATAKNDINISSDAIVANPRDLSSFKDNKEQIEKSYRILGRGMPEEVIQSSIKTTLDKAILSSIEVALANNNPEEAEAIRKHYAKSGDLSAVANLGIQGKIKKGLQDKIEYVQTQTALKKAEELISEEGIKKTILPKSDGKDYDPKKFEALAKLLGQSPYRGDDKPAAIIAMYLLGEEKSKEALAVYEAKAKAWEDYSKREAQAEKDKKPFEEKPPEKLSNPFVSMLSPEQRTVYEEYMQTFYNINSGDVEYTKNYLIKSYPEIANQPKLLEELTKAFGKRHQATKMQNEAIQARQSQEIYGRICNGEKWEAIPAIEKEKLTDAQRTALKNFSERRGGKMSTDSTLYNKYMYDNELLRNTPTAELYAVADRFSERDFGTLMQLKIRLDAGDKVSNQRKRVSDIVADCLSRGGLKPSGDAVKSQTYNIMQRAVVDSIFDWMSESGNNNDRFSDENIRRKATDLLKEQFTINGMISLFDDKYWLKDVISKKKAVGEVGTFIAQGLIADGYYSPSDTDKMETLCRFLLNPKRTLPGEQMLYQRIPEADIKAINAAYKKRGYLDPPDRHTVITYHILGLVNRKDKIDALY